MGTGYDLAMTCHEATSDFLDQCWPGRWLNIKMPSYQYRKSHCGDKTILWSSYLHNGISYTGKITSLYWIRAQALQWHMASPHDIQSTQNNYQLIVTRSSTDMPSIMQDNHIHVLKVWACSYKQYLNVCKDKKCKSIFTFPEINSAWQGLKVKGQ